MKPCWILCTERTGSTYLADLLNSTGIWGDKGTNDEVTGKVDRFTEYYCDRFFCDRYLIDLPKFNKITWWQFNHYFPQQFDLIESCLPDVRFVHLSRQDSVAVAVSYYLAERLAKYSGGRWNLHDTPQAEQMIEVPVDREELRKLYVKAREARTLWKEFLAGRDCIEFDYEDVYSDPTGVVERTLNYIEAEGSPNLEWSKLPVKIFHPSRQKLVDVLKKEKVGITSL